MFVCRGLVRDMGFWVSGVKESVPSRSCRHWTLVMREEKVSAARCGGVLTVAFAERRL